jgi:hypothetical protein
MTDSTRDKRKFPCFLMLFILLFPVCAIAGSVNEREQVDKPSDKLTKEESIAVLNKLNVWVKNAEDAIKIGNILCNNSYNDVVTITDMNKKGNIFKRMEAADIISKIMVKELDESSDACKQNNLILDEIKYKIMVMLVGYQGEVTLFKHFSGR